MDRLHRWVGIWCRDLKIRIILDKIPVNGTYRMTNDQTGSDIRHEGIAFQQIFYACKSVFVWDMDTDHKVQYRLNFVSKIDML